MRRDALRIAYAFLFVVGGGTLGALALSARRPETPPLVARTIPIVAIGTQIDVAGRDEDGRPLPTAGRRIVVSMSDCGSCSVLALDMKRLGALRLKEPLILVYPDRRTLRATPRVGLRTIDRQPSFLAPVMRAFRPHAAVVDGRGFVVAAAMGGPDVLDLIQWEAR